MKRGYFALAIFQVFIILSFLSITTAFPRPEKATVYDDYDEVEGRFWESLFQDNSDAGKRARLSKIRFLYRRSNNYWEALPHAGSYGSGDWNKNWKIKVLIHGFTPNILLSGDELVRSQDMFNLGQTYGRDHNVIVVDWTALSKEPLPRYNEAATSTLYVGGYVAQFLVKLQKHGFIPNWNNVHIIGYSLGGHVSGVAGHQVHTTTGSKVGRITGLDPAGPYFDNNGQLAVAASRALDRADAHFVDIIHCNMGNIGSGRLGSTVVAGHADFYPNGGEVQKGCFFNPDRVSGSSCSHGACVQHFIKSISSPLVGCPCTSWEKYTSKYCPCHNGIYMGEHCSHGASGKYYLET